MLLERMTGFSTLEGQAYAALTTFDQHGQPIAVPVWFALDGEKLYIALAGDADDVKRIHHNAQVEIAPCSADGRTLGASIEAMAVILAGSKSAAARHCLNQKYGWQRRLRDLLPMVAKTVYLEITAM